MTLILYAIPVFMVLLLAEVMLDRRRGTGHYRLNDAIAFWSLALERSSVTLVREDQTT